MPRVPLAHKLDPRNYRINSSNKRSVYLQSQISTLLYSLFQTAPSCPPSFQTVESISSGTSKPRSTHVALFSRPQTFQLSSPSSLHIFKMDTMTLPAGSKLSTFEVENQISLTTLQLSKDYFDRNQGIHEFTIALCRQHDHGRRNRQAPDPSPETVNFLFLLQVRRTFGFGLVAERLVGQVGLSHNVIDSLPCLTFADGIGHHKEVLG